MKIRIAEGGYLYTEDTKGLLAIGYFPLVVECAKRLLALQRWTDENYTVDPDEPLLKYMNGAYPTAIVLEIEGVPMGTVRMVDDCMQFVQFTQSRIEQ